MNGAAIKYSAMENAPLTELIICGILISIVRLVRRMSMEQLLRVLTDPVSNKILQTLRVRGCMTTAQILAENPQLSRATVYRRIEKMLETGAIRIADSRKVRGQTEQVYAIGEIYIGTPETDEESRKMVTFSLMRILDLYDRYFEISDADVNRDRLFLTNYSISLTDADFSEMLHEIFRIVDSYQKKQSEKDAKLRNLFLLSAPKGETHESEK